MESGMGEKPTPIPKAKKKPAVPPKPRAPLKLKHPNGESTPINCNNNILQDIASARQTPSIHSENNPPPSEQPTNQPLARHSNPKVAPKVAPRPRPKPAVRKSLLKVKPEAAIELTSNGLSVLSEGKADSHQPERDASLPCLTPQPPQSEASADSAEDPVKEPIADPDDAPVEGVESRLSDSALESASHSLVPSEDQSSCDGKESSTKDDCGEILCQTTSEVVLDLKEASSQDCSPNNNVPLKPPRTKRISRLLQEAAVASILPNKDYCSGENERPTSITDDHIYEEYTDGPCQNARRPSTDSVSSLKPSRKAPPPPTPPPASPLLSSGEFDKLDVVVPSLYGTNEEIFYEEKVPKYDAQGYLSPRPSVGAMEPEYSYVDIPSDEEEDDPIKRREKKRQKRASMLSNLYEAVMGPKRDSLSKRKSGSGHASVFYYEIDEETKERLSQEAESSGGSKLYRSKSCAPPKSSLHAEEFKPRVPSVRRAESHRVCQENIPPSPGPRKFPPPLPLKRLKNPSTSSSLSDPVFEENEYAVCNDDADTEESPPPLPLRIHEEKPELVTPPPLPARTPKEAEEPNAEPPPPVPPRSPVVQDEFQSPPSVMVSPPSVSDLHPAGEDENEYIIPGQESDNESQCSSATCTPPATPTPQTPPPCDRNTLTINNDCPYLNAGDGECLTDHRSSFSSNSSDSYIYPDSERHLSEVNSPISDSYGEFGAIPDLNGPDCCAHVPPFHCREPAPGQDALYMNHDASQALPIPPKSQLSSISSTVQSDSEGEEDRQKQMRESKRLRKVHYIAAEIVSSEHTFVSVLRMLNKDFRGAIEAHSAKVSSSIVPQSVMGQIFKYLPQLQVFNEDLLKDLTRRLEKWDQDPRVADIFVKKGPFLKMYTDYIREFELMCKTLDEARARYPEIDKAVSDFESSPVCKSFAVKHYMLKPIQRIPQYRLLLQDYKKHLHHDSADYKDTEIALAIVSEVADHANQSMKYGDNLIKLLEIQNSLIGQFEVIRPGRYLVKEGILNKLSRKEMQPRMFYLFNDVLLYTTPVSAGFKLNNILPLTGMKVSRPTKEDFQNEFSIITTQRSFTISASTSEEKEEWLSVLEETIAENLRRRFSYSSKQSPSIVNIEIDTKDFKLGTRAPVWIPDARVSMCMICTAEFTVTFRRHHCRACGKVVCGFCSDCKAPLRYLMYKPARVCQECFEKLSIEIEELSEESSEAMSPTTENGTPIEGGNKFSKASLKARFKGMHMGSFGKGVFGKKRPAVLQEVSANVEDAEMSGYLKMWKNKRWKKMWFVLKGKVLYTYKASEDAAADDSKVLLGYEVRVFSSWFQGIEPSLVFELIHQGTPSLIFRTESPLSRDKWICALRNATIP